MFGKCRRIENNQIIFVGVVCIVQILECIFTKGFVAFVTGEIQINVSICQFYGFSTTINGMNHLGLPTHGINGKAARITEHIQYAFVLSIVLQQTAIFSLIDKESGFLSM